MKNLFRNALITVASFVAVISVVSAWTGPTAVPPGNNVAAPVNVGNVTQVKNGSLGLMGNLATSMVQVNGVKIEDTACPSTGLVARDSGGILLSCQSGYWKKAGGLTNNLVANSLQINGVVVENTACASTGLVERDSTGVLLSCQSGLWKKAGGGTSGTGFACKGNNLCGRTPGQVYEGLCLTERAHSIPYYTSVPESPSYSGPAQLKWIAGNWHIVAPVVSNPAVAPMYTALSMGGPEFCPAVIFF